MKSLKTGSDVRICDFLTEKQDFTCSLMISECDNADPTFFPGNIDYKTGIHRSIDFD